MTLSISTLVFLAILAVAVGLFHFKIRPDSAEFHVSRWSAAPFAVCMSLLGLFGAGELVALTELWYQFRWSVVAFFLGVIGALVFLALAAKRARGGVPADVSSTSALGDFSLNDVVYRHYGIGSARVTMLACYLGLGALFLIQLVVGGLLLSIASELSYTASVILIGAVVGLYVILGGLKGILATDDFQVLVMAAGLALLIFYSTPETVHAPAASEASSPEEAPAFAELAKFDLWISFTLFIGGFAAICGGADVWQRLLAAQSDRSATVSFLASAGGWIILGVIMVLFGMKLEVLLPSEAIGATTPFLAFLKGATGDLMTVIIAACLLCALFSTADTEVFVISTLVSREMRPRAKTLNPQVTRAVVAVTCAIAIWLALLLAGELSYLYTVIYTLLMVTAPMALGAIMNRGNATWMMPAGVLGFAVFLVMVYHDFSQGPEGAKWLQGPWAALIAVPTTIAAIVLPSARKPDVVA